MILSGIANFIFFVMVAIFLLSRTEGKLEKLIAVIAGLAKVVRRLKGSVSR